MASTTPSYIDDAQNLLGQTAPVKDNSMDWDLGGNYLFNWGGASQNKAIQQRQAQLTALKSQITADQFKRLQDAVNSNSADWNKLTTQILGADGQKLHDQYAGFEAQDTSNLNDLKSAFGQYKDNEDLFADKNFYGDVGDVTNAAFPTAATVAAQRANLAKYNTLSNTQETAQERLQRLMAQREADANMKGARDSIAQNLKARGVYGSGAEVVQNMMSQADEANRRYMANLAADAQAQQRAMSALGSGSALAAQMRNSETQEGSLANQVNMFNNQVNQQTSNARSAAQQAGRTTDNQAHNQMATTTYQGAQGNTDRQRGDLNTVNTTTGNLTQGTINNRNAGVNSLNTALDVFGNDIDKKNATLESEKTSGLLGNIG